MPAGPSHTVACSDSYQGQCPVRLHPCDAFAASLVCLQLLPRTVHHFPDFAPGFYIYARTHARLQDRPNAAGAATLWTATGSASTAAWTTSTPTRLGSARGTGNFDVIFWLAFWAISPAFLSFTPTLTRAMCYDPLGAHAGWVLIGAWGPTLCPNRGYRCASACVLGCDGPGSAACTVARDTILDH